MKKPDIETTLKDENDVLWRVLAFRQLSEAEMVQRIRFYLQSTSPKDHPKPGGSVTMETSAGMLPGL